MGPRLSAKSWAEEHMSCGVDAKFLKIYFILSKEQMVSDPKKYRDFKRF